MGFTIDYGAPGAFMAVLIVLGAAGLLILARFFLSVVKGARDDVIDRSEDGSEE